MFYLLCFFWILFFKSCTSRPRFGADWNIFYVTYENTDGEWPIDVLQDTVLEYAGYTWDMWAFWLEHCSVFALYWNHLWGDCHWARERKDGQRWNKHIFNNWKTTCTYGTIVSHSFNIYMYWYMYTTRQLSTYFAILFFHVVMCGHFSPKKYWKKKSSQNSIASNSTFFFAELAWYWWHQSGY